MEPAKRWRRGVRVLGRIALCAAALLGGVALAHTTRGMGFDAHDVARAAMPVAHAADTRTPMHLVLTASARMPAPDVPREDGPTPAILPVVGGVGGRFVGGLTIPGATPNRLILFTFDDGPDRWTTPKLLNRLDAAGVHAVFFLSGWRIRGDAKLQRDQREIARDAVRRGHIVASHTIDHLALPSLDSSAIVAQLETNEQIFQQAFGERPWLFRPPFGAHTTRTDALFQDRGYTIVLWNLGTGDYQVRTAQDVHTTWRRVFERRERENGEQGGIVLLHDTHAWSVEAFTLIFDDLMARNCKLLEEGSELYDIVDDPTFFFAARGDSPAGTEAPPAAMSPGVLAARQARLRQATQLRCGAIATR